MIHILHVIPTGHAFNACDVSSSSDAKNTSDTSNASKSTFELFSFEVKRLLR